MPLQIDLKLAPCIPPFWARGGHAQTILAHLIPSPTLHRRDAKFLSIEVAGGDCLNAELYEGSSETVIYLFHGLSGDTSADYMNRTALVSRRLGHTVILVNHRGCGPGSKPPREPYHSGRADDLAAAIARGRELFPRKRHIAIGFSLSGNALLLLLSNRQDLEQPDAAISVNAPINLERAALMLKQGLNRIYDWRFVLRLRAEVARRVLAHADLPRYRVPVFTTLHDFDDIYTAPAGGFTNREDYYTRCSTRGLLGKIRTPTILITAKDDPFVDYRDYAEAELSPFVHLHAEGHGGHVGYYTRKRTPLGDHRWLDYALNESIRALSLAIASRT